MGKAWVITAPNVQYSSNAMYCFKKTIVLNRPMCGEINITADARYKLWINGNVAAFGPVKGYGDERFYDTVDISGYLRNGENEIFVEVLQLSSEKDVSEYRFLSSVSRTGNLAFLLTGKITCDGGRFSLCTDGTWLCAKDEGLSLIKPHYAWYGGMGEHRMFGRERLCWVPAKEWVAADELIYGGESKLWKLSPSDLPQQTYISRKLNNRDAAGNFDYGNLVTGFVRIKAHGNGKIKLTYAESYCFDEDGLEVKKNRTDCSGEIRGDYDLIQSDGSVEYETFWFRTFRFIKAEIIGDVKIDDIRIMETGYPLKIYHDYDFGNDVDNRLWEISVRTLKLCMHETYEDCPYYEQLQYAMDTYLQILFSFRLSGDHALAKRALRSFISSYQAGRMCCSRQPSITPQRIMGFNFYVIFMLDVIERYTHDHDFVRNYLWIIDAIFQDFERMRNEDGLVCCGEDWNFVDWANGWEKSQGVPAMKAGEPLAIYNMMYVCALEKSANLNLLFGYTDIAADYTKRAEQLKKSVKEKCFCKECGLYADTPSHMGFSQHAQVWSVLCGLEEGEESGELMRKAMSLQTKGGFAYAYHIFRALEKAGVYELSQPLMKQYYHLLEMNCTTIPETPENPRSECHGWGAVAIYEFTSMILGVKEYSTGVKVEPYIAGRTFAKGSVYTECGRVYVEWKCRDGHFKIFVKAEKECAITIILPDGSQMTGAGTVIGKCMLKKGELLLASNGIKVVNE